MTPAPLPKFNKPPVTEVALGVQFRPLTFSGPALGALWETLRSEFPLIEEQPPLLPITDDFGPPRPPQFNIEMGGQPFLSRYWFISEDRSRLLQLQHDRLVFNWRREGADSAYPHYEAIRKDFDRCLDAVKQFAGTHLGDSVEPTWAEATYVNLRRARDHVRVRRDPVRHRAHRPLARLRPSRRRPRHRGDGEGHRLGLPDRRNRRPARDHGALDARLARRHLRRHPIGCAAAIASIGAIRDEGMLENATARGAQLQAGLRTLQQRHPGIGDIRGLGLMVGVELVDAAGWPDAARTKAVQLHCRRESHVILLDCATDGNVIRLVPPLVVSAEQVGEALAALGAALDATA